MGLISWRGGGAEAPRTERRVASSKRSQIRIFSQNYLSFFFLYSEIENMIRDT